MTRVGPGVVGLSPISAPIVHQSVARRSAMPVEPVVVIGRVLVGIGIALLALGFWLRLLGGEAPSCADSVEMRARGCSSDLVAPAAGRAESVDPATAALVFLCAGGTVAGGGIVMLVVRRPGSRSRTGDR
jgi:hypothetical protein